MNSSDFSGSAQFILVSTSFSPHFKSQALYFWATNSDLLALAISAIHGIASVGRVFARLKQNVPMSGVDITL